MRLRHPFTNLLKGIKPSTTATPETNIHTTFLGTFHANVHVKSFRNHWVSSTLADGAQLYTFQLYTCRPGIAMFIGEAETERASKRQLHTHVAGQLTERAWISVWVPLRSSSGSSILSTFLRTSLLTFLTATCSLTPVMATLLDFLHNIPRNRTKQIGIVPSNGSKMPITTTDTTSLSGKTGVGSPSCDEAGQTHQGLSHYAHI